MTGFYLELLSAVKLSCKDSKAYISSLGHFSEPILILWCSLLQVASSANTDALILFTGASRANTGTRMLLNTGDRHQCQHWCSDAFYCPEHPVPILILWCSVLEIASSANIGALMLFTGAYSANTGTLMLFTGASSTQHFKFKLLNSSARVISSLQISASH